jgi:hypothetical protein
MMAKHKDVRRAWGLADPNGDLWFETFAFKRRAIEFAVQRCIGAGEYERLGNDSARWQLAYKRGFRILPVDIRRVR